ncbi:MAG: hypothetical protein WCG98_06495 [bacterium]
MTKYFSGSKTVRDEFQQEFQSFSLQHPNKATMCVQTENSIGNFLYNTKNVVCCFDMKEMENARYCYSMTMGPNKNCMDVSSFGIGIERIYNS